MSTSYFDLAEVISFLNVEEHGDHQELSVFTQQRLAGTLKFDTEDAELKEFLYMFRGKEVCRTSSIKGSGNWKLTHEGTSRTRQVISEYGETVDIMDLIRTASECDGPDHLPDWLAGGTQKSITDIRSE